MKFNISIIIEARMNSSRLPGKVLLKSNKIPMIIRMIKRLKKSQKIKQFIVASTLNKKDNILERKLNKLTHIYRGSETNVIQRVLNAANKFKVEHIVKICGDSPLIDVEIVDKMVDVYFKKPDYLANNLKRTFPDGMDIEIFSRKILEKSYLISKSKLNKEHVTYFIRKSNLFSKLNYKSLKTNYCPDLKLTLDTYQDFENLNKIIKKFKNKIHYNCEKIIFEAKKIKINLMYKIKTLIVGLGKIGMMNDINCISKKLTHCSTVHLNKAFDLIGGVDKKDSQRKKFEKKYKKKAFYNLELAIEKLKPELIVIATPVNTHLEYIEKLKEHKIIILLEKPISKNFDDSKKIFKIIKKK